MEILAWLGVIAYLVAAFLVIRIVRKGVKKEEAAFQKRLALLLDDIRRLPVGQLTYQPPPVPRYVGIWLFELPPRKTITPSAYIIDKAARHYLKAVEAGKVEKQVFTAQSTLVVFVDNHVKRLL